MIFQDLGPEGNPVPRSFDYLIPRIAASLVKLHTQCDVTKFEKYLAMRKEAGLGGLMDDQRRYGLVKQMMRFDLGKEALVKLISKREGDQLALTLADELCGIKERVENPRQFFSLIHDDLGNARQTFEVGNEIYLLDFEYSKYTHSLLEFGKLLIGKFEWTIETDICLWTNPGFPLQLPLEYRRIMEKDSGIFYDDDEWNRGLADALIYWSICLLGRLTYMDEKQPLVGSVKQNANGVINRLVQLLQDIPAETCMETVGKRFISLRL